MERFGFKGKLHKANNRYGFTLVELVLVMTILTILASVSVISLIKWQESSDFKQQNEYAQILFISAQNQLAEYENTQRIERFVSELQDSGGNLRRVLDVTRLTNGKGEVYPSISAVWYESIGSGSQMEASKYQGELCYAACMLGDYEQYKKGALSQAAKDRGADVVFALLENYVYDKNILNASISVEFSPQEGQVFAVCYRSVGGEFVYAAPSQTATNGKINIANREESYRRGQRLGYYGTDTLAKATKDASVKPKLANVKLNNEETLNLSFSVVKPVGVSQALTYDIKVFDANEDKLVLSFKLSGSQLRSYENRRTVPVRMTGYSYGTGGVGSPVALGSYDVLAWIENDMTIRVVFDAADIEATTNQYLADVASLGKEGSDKKPFAKTYSFHRFGLDTENIYCTLQASGSIYRDSAEKQTAVESVYFASAKLPKESDAQQIFTYQISNARHLYNVRYAEDYSLEKTASLSSKINAGKPWNFNFQITKPIDWKAFMESQNLYRSDAKILPLPQIFAADDGRKPINAVTGMDFPSIRQLRYGDSFSGEKNTANVIKNPTGQILNLTLSKDSNEIYDVYSSEDRPVGLFIVNDGILANLLLDGVKVFGEDSVGAFCGVNRGHMLGLVINSSVEQSEVSGQTNVGGIMGYQASVNDSALTRSGEATFPVLAGLVNRARVSGREYVGGIVGKICIPADAQQPQIILNQCENYGALVAVNSAAVEAEKNQIKMQTEPRYLGGIVGYCDNRYVNAAGERDSSRLRVVSCISSPQYTREDLVLYLEKNVATPNNLGNVLQESYTGRNLKGVYVGGIVGFNNYASIEECSTLAENNNTGYLFGYQYVGGIVGFNQGPASGIRGGSTGINQANVIGCRYVGGITGCNSNIRTALDANGVIQPDKTINYKVKVDGWRNEGVVFAKECYAGGIAGYNTGWIYNCNSRVWVANYTDFFTAAYSGDYVGGIAGYNNGIIGNTDRVISEDGKSSTQKAGADKAKTIETVCHVSGDSYVGGIVGYNDVDAVVENYKVVGGHILGNKSSGMYVGGYAGFNGSVRMLLNDNGESINLTANPNEVTGRYFVGGTIGGNIINTKLVASAESSVGQPTTPQEAAVKQTGDVYAKCQNWNSWSSGYGYYVAFDLCICNETPNRINTWSVALDTKASATIWEWKCVDEGDRVVISGPPGQYFFVNANSVVSQHAQFYVSSEEELKKFEKQFKTKKIPVSYFDFSENSVGQFWGNAASPQDCSISMEQAGVNYKITIVNHTGTPLPNWRVEVALPEGIVGPNGFDVHSSVENNTLILDSGEDAYNAVLAAYATKTMTLYNVSFKNNEAKKAFENQDLRLTFNNVVYSGTPTLNYGGGGGTVVTNLGELSAVFETDNFLGEMSADAFVGGFAGYNVFIEDARADAANALEAALTRKFKESDSRSEGLSKKVEILDSLLAQEGIAPSDCQMFVHGIDNDSETQNSLGVMTAKIFVGGVLGYNDSSTKLYIKNVKNTTPIIATEAIINPNEQPGRTTNYAGVNVEYSYSYAGGIIGKIGKNVVIDHCWNTPSGVVTTGGTYTGGLCELNEGKIINCDVSTMGSTVDNYIGGLCGLNKEDGVISDCRFVNKSVMAKNVVGGIAAENYGQIIRISVSNVKVTATGELIQQTGKVDGVAAAIAGYNAVNGKIILNKDMEAVVINSNGQYVGGVVGYNEGIIENSKPQRETEKLAVRAGSNIIGRENVGGFIGYNINKNYSVVMEYLSNGATVTGNLGNAGGIIGNNASGNVIRYCENRGVISASNAGNAGGITAENAGVIEKCTDYARVNAPKGMCGGITALNHVTAKLRDCEVRSENASENLVFASMDNVGAIAAKNAGQISGCKVECVLVENYSTSGESNIGIIVGENGATGSIVFAADAEAIKNGIAETYSDNSKVGGVAGVNYGRICGDLLNGQNLPTTVIKPIVRFKANAGKTASFGGVAGLNRGTIENISVQGMIGHDEDKKNERLLGSNKTGYGGIAGFNGFVTGEEAGAAATIKNCTFDGTVWAHGSGAAIASVGGIAGVNGYGGDILECEIGAISIAGETRVWGGDIPAQRTFIDGLSKTGNTANKANLQNGEYSFLSSADSVSYTYTGGISGVNYGRILSCDNNRVASGNKKVFVECLSGNNGGITGIAYEGSIIAGTAEKPVSTGSNWTVEAHMITNDVGTGGIVGNYFSGQDVKYVDNYATVKNRYLSNTNVGGLFGTIAQNERAGITVSHCNNYGNVLSASRAAGFVARDAFQGIRFEYCNSYGEIRALPGTTSIVAGFVGQTTQIVTDISFYKCNNYSNLVCPSSVSYAAGFLANKSGNGTAYMQDCVNLGTIRRFTNNNATNLQMTSSVSKAAGFICNSNSISYIDNCRNYGVFDSAPAFAGSGGAVLTNSLDTSGSNYSSGMYPLTANVNTASRINYYVGKNNVGSQGKMSAGEPGGNAYFRLTTDYPFCVDNNAVDILGGVSGPSRRLSSSNKSVAVKDHLHFDVVYADGCPGMDSLVWMMELSRNYVVQATLEDESGNKAVVTKNLTAVSSTSDYSSARDVVFDIDGLVRNGELASHRVVAIDLEVTLGADNKPMVHYGFQWIACGGACRRECDSMQIYDYESHQTGFNLSYAFKDNKVVLHGFTTDKTDANGLKKYLISSAEQDVFYENYLYHEDSHVRIASKSGKKDVAYYFDINYLENAKGIDKFYTYFTNEQDLVNTDTENIRYYYVARSADGAVMAQTQERTINLCENPSYEAVFELNDSQKKAAKIELHVITVNKDWFRVKGFKWAECGNADKLMICRSDLEHKTMEYLAVEPAPKRELIVVNEAADGSFDLIPANMPIAADAKIRMSGLTQLRGTAASGGYYADNSVYAVQYDINANGWSNNSRAALYKELDEKFEKFLYACNYRISTKLKAPTGLSVSNSGGYYVFKWNKDLDAFNYLAYYTLADENGQEVYSGKAEAVEVSASVCQAKFLASDLDGNWSAAGGDGRYTATFYVKAVNAYHKLHANDADADKYDSEYVSKDQKKLIVLPKPIFHIEPIEGGKFVAILDNMEDYAEFADVCKPTGTLDTINFEINMDTGMSAPLTVNLTAKSDYTYTAKVESKDTSQYMTSESTRLFGTMMGTGEYPATGINASTRYQMPTTFGGFHGLAADALSYQLTYGANNRDLHMAADIVAMDEKLGVPVAYASGTVHAANRVNEKFVYISTTLAGYDGSIIGKDIEIRDYPYMSQNGVCVYGHDVASGVTLKSHEDLKLIVDENYIDASGRKTARSILDANGNLRPGYVIRANQDVKGTYDIFWSSSLQLYESEERPYQVAKINYTVAKDAATGELLTNADGYNYYVVTSVPSEQRKDLPMQPIPIIETNGYPIVKQKDNHATYTFEWDKGKTGALYENATYALELFGRTRTDEIISLKTVNVVKDTKYTFVDEQDNWNYKELILQVSRNGSTTDGAATEILPRTAEEKFAVKLKLTTIAKPKVMLAIDKETQHFDKNNLRYEVTWSALTDKDELADLGGYLITAYTLRAKDQSTDPDIIDRKVCFYAPEATTLKQWQDALAESIEVQNEDILASEEIPPEDYVSNGTSRQGIIDLSGFAAKDYVYVRVQAIAKPNSVLFADGDASEPSELEIQERLKTPFVKGEGCSLIVKPSYDGENAMSITELNTDGILFTLYNPAYTLEDNGKYEIAIAVYDEQGKALQDENAVAKENSVERLGKSSAWADGAVEILAKKGGTTMSGENLQEAAYNLKFTDGRKLTDYAGMWLKIAFRATTDNKISSFWTDEDPAEAESINYQWIRIPRAELDAPNLQFGTAQREYRVDATESEYVISRHTVSFAETDYAQEYCVMLTGADPSRPVTWLYLQKKEDGSYEVFYASTEHVMNAYKIDGGSYRNPYADLAVAEGIREGEKIELLMYQSDYYIVEDDTVTLTTTLEFKDGVFTLELPDVAMLTDANGKTVEGASAFLNVTGEIVVQAYMKDANDYRYCDSKRVGSVFLDNEFTQPVLLAPEDRTEVDDLEFTVIYDKVNDEYYIVAEPQKDMVMQILTANGEDTVVSVEYVAFGQNALGQKRAFRIRPGEEENGESELQYYVRFVTVGGDAGIAKWSDGYRMTVEDGKIVLKAISREPNAYVKSLEECRAEVSIKRKPAVAVATPGNATPGNAMKFNMAGFMATPGNAQGSAATPGNADGE